MNFCLSQGPYFIVKIALQIPIFVRSIQTGPRGTDPIMGTQVGRIHIIVSFEELSKQSFKTHNWRTSKLIPKLWLSPMKKWKCLRQTYSALKNQFKDLCKPPFLEQAVTQKWSNALCEEAEILDFVSLVIKQQREYVTILSSSKTTLGWRGTKH